MGGVGWGGRGRRNKQEGKESRKEICKPDNIPPSNLPRPFSFSVKTFVNVSLALAHSQWQVLLATSRY